MQSLTSDVACRVTKAWNGLTVSWDFVLNAPCTLMPHGFYRNNVQQHVPQSRNSFHSKASGSIIVNWWHLMTCTAEFRVWRLWFPTNSLAGAHLPPSCRYHCCQGPAIVVGCRLSSLGCLGHLGLSRCYRCYILDNRSFTDSSAEGPLGNLVEGGGASWVQGQGSTHFCLFERLRPGFVRSMGMRAEWMVLLLLGCPSSCVPRSLCNKDEQRTCPLRGC